MIAKLDRLARSVYVTAALHKAGVDFVACDYPDANRLTIQILAAVAENEARVISQRTTDVLAAYRDGKRLQAASDCFTPTACRPTSSRPQRVGLGHRSPSAVILRRRREQRAPLCQSQDAGPRRSPPSRTWLPGCWRCGQTRKLTCRVIGNRLNEEGHTTRTGKPWSPTAVKRVLDRAREA